MRLPCGFPQGMKTKAILARKSVSDVFILISYMPTTTVLGCAVGGMEVVNDKIRNPNPGNKVGPLKREPTAKPVFNRRSFSDVFSLSLDDDLVVETV